MFFLYWGMIVKYFRGNAFDVFKFPRRRYCIINDALPRWLISLSWVILGLCFAWKTFKTMLNYGCQANLSQKTWKWELFGSFVKMRLIHVGFSRFFKQVGCFIKFLKELWNCNWKLYLSVTAKTQPAFKTVIFHDKFTLWHIKLTKYIKINLHLINSIYMTISSLEVNRRLIQIKV